MADDAARRARVAHPRWTRLCATGTFEAVPHMPDPIARAPVPAGRLVEMTDKEDRPPTSFFAELKRRRVFRVGIGYGMVAFVVLQAADLAANAHLITEDAFRLLMVGALIMLPVVLLLGWVFDVTPEGVRIATRSGDRLVTGRVKPSLVYAMGVLVLVGGLGAVVTLDPPRSATAAVAPGADVIAVLPFTTRGAGMELLAEGMVDLLSRNLDEVGPIRTVDSRTVLYRWQERSKGGELPLEEALAVGRDVQAGSVLTGSVVAAGREVRISAELFAVGGRQLAAVRVDGSADSVLSLVDNLSVALLREIWRSSQALPQLDVGAITSENLDAIRAFMEGERHYRMGEWKLALNAFARAVAADAFFPLAHYRLATTADWIRGGDGGASRRSIDFAMQYLDRLPGREQTLIRAQRLGLDGNPAEAVDTLRAYLTRYPDDAEAWYARADIEYHQLDGRPTPGRRPVADQLALFDRALALDPSFTPALLHPLTIAFESGDSALIERYTGILGRTGAADVTAMGILRAAAGAMRPGASGEAVAGALTLALTSLDTASSTLAWQASNTVVLPLLHRAALLPSAAQRQIGDRMVERVARGDRSIEWIHATYDLLIAGGRLAAARAFLQAPATQLQTELIGPLLRWPVYVEVVGEAFSPAAEVPAGARVAFDLLGALSRADTAGLRGAAGSAGSLERAPDGSGIGDVLEGAALGFARVVSGDTAAGLAAVEEALLAYRGAAPQTMNALWFRWAERLAAHPPTRDRAIELLERPWSGRPIYEPLRVLALARAYEAAGRREPALAAYGRFVEAMAGADPDLALQPDLEQAKSTLARLGGAR